MAVVVGGTRRVGRWVSETLLRDGSCVHALYRGDEAAARELKQWAQADGGDLYTARVDATDYMALSEVISAIASQHGRIDMLVNSAGPAGQGAITEAEPAEFERLWRGNVLAVHDAVLAALPYMQQGGRIISFVSAGADTLRAYRDVPLYAACKTALVSYSRSLARELAPRGITVNCIALGITTLAPEGAPAVSESHLPVQRRVEQADVAAALLYLASPAASQLTGTVLNMSGGWAL
jgi:3-oxoacyl-[acyl-carrier protein] reductase